MSFTTKLILKKDKPAEKYPYPVLTQHSYNVEVKNENTRFELNLAAMVGFEFIPDVPIINRINWGVDDVTGKLMLANTKGAVEDKISNISAKNIFSNLAFMDKLVKEFSIDPLQTNEFKLNLQNDGDFIVATLELIQEEEEAVASPGYVFKVNEEEPMSDTGLEELCDAWGLVGAESTNSLF